MFRLLIVFFFICTITADIFYKWNEHSVFVKIFGEHVKNDHLLDHWHVLSNRYHETAKIISYSFPEDVLQVSQIRFYSTLIDYLIVQINLSSRCRWSKRTRLRV